MWLRIAAPRRRPRRRPPWPPRATSVRREGDCEAGEPSQQESRRNEHRHNNESSYLNN